MQTVFSLGTFRWTDTELPLTNIFGFLSDDNRLLSIQVRSEKTSASSDFSAGRIENNYERIVSVDAYNSLSATERIAEVIVVKQNVLSSTELQMIISQKTCLR